MREKRYLVGVLAVSLFLFAFLFIFHNFTGFTILGIDASQDANYVDGYIIKEDSGISSDNILRLGENSDFSQNYRSFIDFDTSNIPDNAVVHNVTLELTVSSVSEGLGIPAFNVYSLPETASSLEATPSTLNSRCGGTGSTSVLANSNAFNGKSAGDVVNVSLTTAANTQLQNNLTSDFFTVCMQSTTEDILQDLLIYLNSSESGAPPRLIVNYTVADSTAPQVEIIYPGNVTYGSGDLPLVFNVSVNDTDGSVANVNYTLDNGANNFTMTNGSSLIYYNATNSSIADGSYVFIVYAQDNSGNLNSTENVSFSVDVSAPFVNYTSSSVTSSSATLYFNVSDGLEITSCTAYAGSSSSVNSSYVNKSQTNSISVSGLSASTAYSSYVNCTDSVGNVGNSTTRSITTSAAAVVDTPSGGGGGGGGSSCSISSWECGEWSACIDGKESRECTSNCNTVKTEEQICQTECTNECSIEGNSCDGNSIVNCKIDSNGCYKISDVEDCSNEQVCAEGACLSKELVINNEEENVILKGVNYVGKSLANLNIRRPSDFIPHGNIPDIVVDVGVTGTGVAAVGGVAWWVYLLIASSFLPFFLIKLRHYSVSIMDSSNILEVFKNEKVDESRLLHFLELLEKNYGEKIAFASKRDDLVQYIIRRGFIEIRLDDPFVLIGHFTKSRESKRFEGALRKTLDSFMGRKIIIFKNVERTSIISALRAWKREKKAKKEFDKVK